MATAEAQLELARRERSRLGAFEQGSPEHAKALDRTLRAYGAVHTHHPQAAATRAEAAFRAARVLAVAGRVEEALEQLPEAVRLGEGTEFRARAGLESGRLMHHAGRAEASLEAYFRVASSTRAAPRYREEAWLRVGDAWCARGDVSGARRAWRRVCDGTADPRRRALAYDRIGRSWIAEEDLEAAAGVLAESRAALLPIAQQRTEQGERARRALRAMRLVEELERAIEERWERRRSTRDASLESYRRERVGVPPPTRRPLVAREFRIKPLT